MIDNPIAQVDTLVFDIFGTVLDLGGSLSEPAGRFLEEHGSPVTADEFWADWRGRQRIEQYQDNLFMLGHSGYLETCRRSFLYCLRMHGVDFEPGDVERFMAVYDDLRPFDDAVQGLKRLVASGQFGLVVLSNGEQAYLERMATINVGIPFDHVISVEKAGSFKPHPAVYRTAARILGKEPPEIMMVSSHSFDVTGARASGFRAGYVNRYNLPNEESVYLPDFEVSDFHQLADLLMSSSASGTDAS